MKNLLFGDFWSKSAKKKAGKKEREIPCIDKKPCRKNCGNTDCIILSFNRMLSGKERDRTRKRLTDGKNCDIIHLLPKRTVAGIAQSVEQLIRNQQVACSSHVSSSRKLCQFAGGAFCFLNSGTKKTGEADASPV